MESEHYPITDTEKKGKVISEIRTVTVEGKLHTAKVVYIDFREGNEGGEEGKHSEVVCHIHGLGNSSREFNRAADKGDFSGVNTLETQAIEEAKEKKGIYFQAQLLELPVVEGTPSFREDARVHLALLEQAGIKVEETNMTINGYSEGAGVAKHLAKLVQEKQGEGDFEDKLRLFSLTGIVPVKDVHKYFSQHVWNQVIMAEAARRVENVVPELGVLANEIQTPKEQMKLIGIILREIAIGNRKEMAMDQLKEAVRGNLQLLADVARRFSYDIWHGPRQMEKFIDSEVLDLDDRWNIEMKLPRKDGVYPLGSWIESNRIPVDEVIDTIDAVAFFNQIIVKKIFPEVRQISVHIFGGSWENSSNYHTGPTDFPKEYYWNEGSTHHVFVRGEGKADMPEDVELALQMA